MAMIATREELGSFSRWREAFAGEKYSRTLELCEILETGYKDTPEGKQGAELAGSIRSSPDKLAVACEHLNERPTVETLEAGLES